MALNKVLFYLLNSIIHFSMQSFVYHENTHIVFKAEDTLNRRANYGYFGYSTLLRADRLFVGAPKAVNRLNESTGAVFACPLSNLDMKLITCQQLGDRNPYYIRYDLRRDVWFGASMLFLTNERLLVSAPRTTRKYDYKNLLMHGASYLLTQQNKGSRILDPLADGGHQAYVTDGIRREYGPSNTHIYYYAQGQVGFSMAVTKMNTVILGTPGLLQWTGGIVSYKFDPNDTYPNTNLQPIMNPYQTMDLDPDGYFGYSVESGIFEKNGKVLYIAGAPRYNLGGGKVLLFSPPTEELKPLDVKVKLLGPQIGSYFGASLCCTDINNDGLDDLLVGAPTFVKKNGALPYDQGAVFVYITKKSPSGFILQEFDHVTGSGADGARFGTVISDLGDINGDGFRDIAIGAPWENEGIGAVYIYMGCANGLRIEKVQRIQPANARGFGISISKGVDVDGNYCNDLAVGAYDSSTSFLYRCIPTMTVRASIILHNAINLEYNDTTFLAMFCVSAPSVKFRSDIKLGVRGKIEVDTENNRAEVVEDAEYIVNISPETKECDERTIYVNPNADLSKPMLLTFKLEAIETMKNDSTKFLTNAARLSDDSTLEASSLVQLMRDCGDDLVCTPWLTMTLEALDNPYIPGANKTLGIKLTVLNEEEPAYGLSVNITLPMHPKRIPSNCSVQNFIMNCDLPQPFSRNEKIIWDIELEYNLNTIEDVDCVVIAKLNDEFHRNVTNKTSEELVLKVTPEASFSVSGKSMPNASLKILRDNLMSGSNVLFKHYFEITNLGPSDWSALTVHIQIPEKTNLSSPIEACEQIGPNYECTYSIPAKVSFPVFIPLLMNLSVEGDFLQENMTYIATSFLYIPSKTKNQYTVYHVTTTLILEPASIIWYIVVPCIFFGLFLLGIIVRILHKRGFFLRKKLEMMKREKENELLDEVSERALTSDDDYENSRLELHEDL